MDSSGSGTIVEPLLALEREDVSGVLEFRAHGVTTQIYARDGEITFAEGGAIEETLGRILVRAERLTEEQVVSILRRMTDALVDGRGIRFGEVLVEYGFLTSDELDLALTQQVREKVSGCIHRGAGDWSFKKDDPRLEEVGSYVVATRPLLIDAAVFLPERRIEDILHIDEQRYPEIVAPERILIDEFELTRAEASVLRDLDGTSSLHFILSTAKVPNTAALIAALVMGGGVHLRTTPTGSRQESEKRSVPPEFRTQRRARFRQDEHTMQMASAPVKKLPPISTPPKRSDSGGTAVLAEAIPPSPQGRTGRKPSSHSSPTVAAASVVPQRRSSRENLPAANEDAETRAREALDRLKIDLETHKPVSSRRRWPDPRDDRERRLMAESAFQRGRLYVRAEDAERALPGLHRAMELRPQEPEYELYVKWAQILVNDSFKDDARRVEIQVLASKIVRATRSCALGYSILGHCFMHDGKDEAALRFFQRAMLLDPKLVDATRLVRVLRTRSEEDAGGGFRKAAVSKVDRAPGRSRLRGAVATPLDEIIPAPIQTAADVALRALSSPSLTGSSPSFQRSDPSISVDVSLTASMTNEAQPEPPAEGSSDRPPATTRLITPKATPAPPHVSVAPQPNLTPQHQTQQHLGTRPIAPPFSRIGPPPMTPRAYPPPPSTPPPPEVIRSLSQPPPPVLTGPPGSRPSVNPPMNATPSVAPPPLSPWRLPTSSVNPPPGPHPSSSASISASIPPMPRAPDFSIPDPPPKKSRAAIAIFVFTTLGVVGGVGYAIHEASEGSGPTANASSSASAAIVPPPVESVSSATTTSSSTAPPTTSSTAASAASSTTTATAPSVSASATSASSASTATTGVLHTKKAYGHRIYVDGRLVGEGGRDLTVPCGAHRVRVGSQGTERSMTIPCGGAIDVD